MSETTITCPMSASIWIFRFPSRFWSSAIWVCGLAGAADTKRFPSGNIRDCLFSDTDYTTWYVDKLGDLRCDAVHHDGTNHYLYRVFKPGVTEAQMDRLKDKIYNGTATRSDIIRLTMRLGDEIGKVYGWDFPQHSRTGKNLER